MSFSSETHVDLASDCSGTLRHVPPSYPPHRTFAWKVAGVGGELAEVHRPMRVGSSTRCGCQRGAARDGAVQHRPSHQRPPRGRPLLCARCRAVVVNWEARSALPAADVPVRPFRRGPEYYPSPTEVLAEKRCQWTTTVMPNHQNLLPNLCLAVIARRRYPVHGHLLGSPIKRGPELELEHAPSLHPTRTTPSHWEGLEEVFFPNSGRLDPLRDPARFTPVRAPLPLSSCQ